MSEQIDERLRQFQAQYCDITMMRDAVQLVMSDPTIQRALPQIQPSEIDFNCDDNLDREGRPVNASNREWAAALIAAAQISRETGLSVESIPDGQIIERGRQIYDSFKAKEQQASAAQCSM